MSVTVPLHGKTWVQPVPRKVEGGGEDIKLGLKVWPQGNMDVLGPKVITLKNHPLVATLQNSPLSLGAVLALQSLLALDENHSMLAPMLALMLVLAPMLVPMLVLVERQLQVTLERLGRKLLHISHLRDQVLRTIRKYGVAGIISVLVGTVSYWLLFLLPVSAYIYHGATSAWLPTLSNPKSIAAFGKILGGVFFCTHLPPIEAARWAWVLSMVPWFQERLPPVLRGAGDLNTMASQPLMVDGNNRLEKETGGAPRE
jgi:hypothetical protein